MLNKSELEKYTKLIDDYIKPNIFASCSRPAGILKYPFVDPSAQYAGNLWDWDSFWVIKVMIMALERYKNHEDFNYEEKKSGVIEHAKGTVMNFFDHEEPDGFIPMMIASSGPFENYYRDRHRAGERHNTHKPFLAQNILQICRLCEDYEWFDAEKLVRYMEYYENEQMNRETGLFFWVDDVMIGMDNNPSVFFRPERSSGDIYLNSYMALEYEATVKILEMRKDERAEIFEQKRRKFVRSVNEIMYDKKDKIYYSQDLMIRKPEDRLVANGFLLHENMLPSWHSIPMKIRFFGCFLPLYSGICSKERALEMDRVHLHDPAVMAKYGIRTVASDEFSYNLEKTSNPSNWLGPIWMVSNYCIYKGLKNYGIDTYREIGEKSIRLLGENLEKTGEMYESYLPDDGQPCLYPHFFNWDLLVMEMLEDYEK